MIIVAGTSSQAVFVSSRIPDMRCIGSTVHTGRCANLEPQKQVGAALP